MKKILLSALAASFLLGSAAPVAAQSSPNAGFEMRLSSMEDNMRALNGQVEQLAYAVRRLDQTLQRQQADVESRLSKVETSVATLQSAADARAATGAPQPTTTATPNLVAPVDGSLGALKTQDGRVTGAINNPKTPPLPETPPDYGLTPQEQYERALGLLRQADYAGGETAFKAFIEKNPKDKMIDNAKYWHAETLYVRGHYTEATAGFADAFQQNPQGTKAPDSLLKLAMSLDADNKSADACTALAELKAKYPRAPSNVKARAAEERAKLKCSTN